MNNQYIGWIPCISGKLYFEFSECELGNNYQFASVNHFDEYIDHKNYVHYVVISSKVNWKDHDHNPYEKKPEDIESKHYSGKWIVSLLGKVDPTTDTLEGAIYMMLSGVEENFTTWLIKNMRELHKLALEKESIGEKYNKLMEELNKFSHPNYHKVTFKLDKLGFVLLEYKSSNNDPIPNADSRTKRTICRQCYYYIKYSFHKHVHHEDTAESLTTIHNFDPDTKIRSDLLLSDLRKSLVQLKRNFSTGELRNLESARGITSYALSLIESCYRKKYIDDKSYSHEKGYFENIKSSLSAKSDEIEKSILRSTQASNNARSLILFLFAIVAPLTILYKEKLVNPETSPTFFITIFSKIVSSNEMLFFSAFILVSLFGFYWFLHVRFGRALFAFDWFAQLIRKCIKENNIGKARFLAIAIIVVLTLLILGLLYDVFYKNLF